MDFRALANVQYRVCVTVKGKATFYLYPRGTKHTINTSSWVKKCNTFKPGVTTHYATAVWVESGKLDINRSTVERYYTGAVPV